MHKMDHDLRSSQEDFLRLSFLRWRIRIVIWRRILDSDHFAHYRCNQESESGPSLLNDVLSCICEGRWSARWSPEWRPGWQPLAASAPPPSCSPPAGTCVWSAWGMTWALAAEPAGTLSQTWRSVLPATNKSVITNSTYLIHILNVSYKVLYVLY